MSKTTYKRRIKKFGGQKQTLPIKDKKTIDKVMYYLLNQIEKAKTPIKEYNAYRNYMLFLIGFNTALRAEDLLQLRVSEVIKGYISIKENKTGKFQNIKMNKDFHNQILDYIKKYNLSKYDYMFVSQIKKYLGKNYTNPITRQQGHAIVRKVAEEVGINYTFGLHSLRKTFGYQYINNGGNVMTLMKMYNHEHPQVTMLYVMWDTEDVERERSTIFIGNKKR